MASKEDGIATRSSGRIARDLLLGLPIVIGGIAAIVLGAYDYLPWLLSPALWLGILTSVVAGLLLVRRGKATPRDIVAGVITGLVLCAVLVLAGFVAIILVWVVWRPQG